MFKLQTFKAAQTAVVPFTLHLFWARELFSGTIANEKILNRAQEELSIHQEKPYADAVQVTIKRDRIKNEKKLLKK